MSHKLFGLTQNALDKITEILKSFPEVEKGLIFGSRALGTYKRGSDVDIALVGEHLEQAVMTISYRLNEELLLPYFFDVVDYNGLTKPELKEHIDRVGVVFFNRR